MCLALLAAACETFGPGYGPPAVPSITSLPGAPVAAVRPWQVPSKYGARNDPYYWLRDDTRRDPDVLKYLAEENAYGERVMAPVKPLEDKLFAEMSGRIPAEDQEAPVFDDEFWYYERAVPGKEYPVYARRINTMSFPEQILLDANQEARGDGYYEVNATAASPNGLKFAWIEDRVGRRQFTLRVKDLATGEVLPDAVPNVQEEFAWLGDNKSLLYIDKDPVTLLGVRVKLHRLGTDPKKDPVVYEEKDHQYYLRLQRARTDRYVYLWLEGTENTEWRYTDGFSGKVNFHTILPREPRHLYYVQDDGTNFVIRTNWNAPNFRIVGAALKEAGDKSRWREVIPERPDVFIDAFEVAPGSVALNERIGGHLTMRVQSLFPQGPSFRVESTEPSYADILVPTPDASTDAVRYRHTTLAGPDTIVDLDLSNGAKRVVKQDTVGGGFDASAYVTEFAMAPARDGREVPVSIVHRTDTRLDGRAPLLQLGYGAYGWSTDPEFDPALVSLLDRGFVVAIAHVRGGQEMGRAWYDEGRLRNKRFTFYDFVDVTTFLVQKRYASPDKVFAVGRSAGGLLIGAVANLAPEKYRGLIADVPFVDVVTTMLDPSIPLTTNEFDEWGDPRRPDAYAWMLAYSPYDNVKPMAYPAMFVSTGLWDSQVQYYEPAKWVAKLRATKTDDHPLVLRVNMEAGHGGESGRYRSLHETAAEYAFMLGMIGIGE